MAKKAELYSEAERLYVQEHLGQTDIAERLGVAERTIRYWATEGNWAERRGNYVEATSKTSEKLYKLVQTLTDKAIESVENGEVPSQSQLFFSFDFEHQSRHFILLVTSFSEYFCMVSHLGYWFGGIMVSVFFFALRFFPGIISTGADSVASCRA